MFIIHYKLFCCIKGSDLIICNLLVWLHSLSALVGDRAVLTSTSRICNRSSPSDLASCFSLGSTGASTLTILFIFSQFLALSKRNRSLLPLQSIVSISAKITRKTLVQVFVNVSVWAWSTDYGANKTLSTIAVDTNWPVDYAHSFGDHIMRSFEDNLTLSCPTRVFGEHSFLPLCIGVVYQYCSASIIPPHRVIERQPWFLTMVYDVNTAFSSVCIVNRNRNHGIHLTGKVT